MLKANTDIREALKASKVPVWACAVKLGVHENTLLRKLRLELPKEEKRKLYEIIKEISENEREEN